MTGKSFTIARRYGESASVKDETGNLSTFVPLDLLPEIEIYGQNEIYEIAQDKFSQRQLLTRFLEAGQQEGEARIQESLDKLAENRKKLIEAQATVAAIEDEVALLPKLEEQVGQFKTLGLEGKLSTEQQCTVILHLLLLRNLDPLLMDQPEDNRDKTANILEGGKTAFNQRKVKYGY